MKTLVFRSLASLVLVLALFQSAGLAQQSKKQAGKTTSGFGVASIEMLNAQYLTSDDNITTHKKGDATEKDKTTTGNVQSIPMPENGSTLDILLSGLIEYPEAAINQGIEGVVKVLCTVEIDGRVSSVMILNDIGGNCAEEVCRVIKSIRFKPAMQNGYARKCNLVVPVIFDLT